jgi:hypothetical protein
MQRCRNRPAPGTRTVLSEPERKRKSPSGDLKAAPQSSPCSMNSFDSSRSISDAYQMTLRWRSVTGIFTCRTLVMPMATNPSLSLASACSPAHRC